jgi:AcrR family transcriptional regulator
MTTAPGLADAKPYHHGDLRRALLDAATLIIERDGANALTLRAVAREAGVSPAAPYHHFKDKGDLLHALAKEGFRRLRQAMSAAETEGSKSPHRMGVAYVEFAHANPALYRVMYDCARSMESLPDGGEDDGSGLALLRQAMVEANDGSIDEVNLGLAAIAGWCASHGLAEISAFPQFKALKDALGGERAFLQAVFDRLGYIDPGCLVKSERK